MVRFVFEFGMQKDIENRRWIRTAFRVEAPNREKTVAIVAAVLVILMASVAMYKLTESDDAVQNTRINNASFIR